MKIHLCHTFQSVAIHLLLKGGLRLAEKFEVNVNKVSRNPSLIEGRPPTPPTRRP
jgi:hypothetical protein